METRILREVSVDGLLTEPLCWSDRWLGTPPPRWKGRLGERPKAADLGLNGYRSVLIPLSGSQIRLWDCQAVSCRGGSRRTGLVPEDAENLMKQSQSFPGRRMREARRFGQGHGRILEKSVWGWRLLGLLLRAALLTKLGFIGLGHGRAGKRGRT